MKKIELCQKHKYVLHETFNNMMVCDKCIEEIKQDEEDIKIKNNIKNTENKTCS